MIASNGWIALIEDSEDDEWWPFDSQGRVSREYLTAAYAEGATPKVHDDDE